MIADYIQFCNGHCIACNPSMILSYQNDLALGQRELKGHSNSATQELKMPSTLNKIYWPMFLKSEKNSNKTNLINQNSFNSSCPLRYPYFLNFHCINKSDRHGCIEQVNFLLCCPFFLPCSYTTMYS